MAKMFCSSRVTHAALCFLRATTQPNTKHTSRFSDQHLQGRFFVVGVVGESGFSASSTSFAHRKGGATGSAQGAPAPKHGRQAKGAQLGGGRGESPAVLSPAARHAGQKGGGAARKRQGRGAALAPGGWGVQLCVRFGASQGVESDQALWGPSGTQHPRGRAAGAKSPAPKGRNARAAAGGAGAPPRGARGGRNAPLKIQWHGGGCPAAGAFVGCERAGAGPKGGRL
jgi:hypothetical protein